MKNALTIVAAGAALFAFACGGDGNDDANKTAAPGTQVASAVPTQDLTPGNVPTADPSKLTPVAPQQVDSTVAVDANSATDAVDAQASYPVGSEFTIAFVIGELGAAYLGYQLDIQWDPAIVSYVSIEHLRPANLSTCTPTRNPDGNRVAAACLDQELIGIRFMGPASLIKLKCIAAGQTALHLRSPEEGLLGTKLEVRDIRVVHKLSRLDATISCQ